ncbi:MAG: hypothetical protein NUV75_02125 [Gallionella sp.]|nr:hypothetical protein [Gallionella sp.]
MTDINTPMELMAQSPSVAAQLRAKGDSWLEAVADCLDYKDAEIAKLRERSAGWLIWSNEHNAWWGPGCCGYPSDIASAGRYTLEQAINICTQRSWMLGHVPPETMVPESALPQIFAKVPS